MVTADFLCLLIRLRSLPWQGLGPSSSLWNVPPPDILGTLPGFTQTLLGYHLPDRPPLNTTSAHMLHARHSLSHDSTLLPPGPAKTICSLVCVCCTSPAQVRPGTEWMLEPHLLDRQLRGRTKGRECQGRRRDGESSPYAIGLGLMCCGRQGEILPLIGDHRKWACCLLLTCVREERTAASEESCTSSSRSWWNQHPWDGPRALMQIRELVRGSLKLEKWCSWGIHYQLE